MSKPAYGPARAVDVCRAALGKGHLVRGEHKHSNHWRYGRRLFSQTTVRALIASGEAVQIGDSIKRAEG